MPNIGYLEIPADNIDRAKHDYRSLFGWKIEPNTNLDPARAAAMQCQDISTGPVPDGTLKSGGMYKRQADEGCKNFMLVEDIDAVLVKVKKWGGEILMQKQSFRMSGGQS